MLVWLLAFLILAYNTAGGLVIDKGATQAVDNSPVLDSCDGSKFCGNPKGPGNSQNAPVGPPNGGPGPHGR